LEAGPGVLQRVATLAEQYGELADRFAIGKRVRRLKALNDRWEKLNAIIDARPPILTLRVRRRVNWLAPPNPPRIEIDLGLLRELRDVEKQAAIEVGQWNSGRLSVLTFRTDQLSCTSRNKSSRIGRV